MTQKTLDAIAKREEQMPSRVAAKAKARKPKTEKPPE